MPPAHPTLLLASASPPVSRRCDRPGSSRSCGCRRSTRTPSSPRCRGAAGAPLEAADVALLLARAKAEDVVTALEIDSAEGGTDAEEDDGILVLGCDSVLELDGEVHGKPADAAEAMGRWAPCVGHTGVLHRGVRLTSSRSAERCDDVIIGGCGSGRHLHRRLLDLGEQVLIVDRPQALRGAPPPMTRAIAADLRDAAAMAELPLGPDDVVHHLAARQFHGAVPWRGRAGWFAAVNVAGTKCLLERMARTGCHRMISFSSDMVYGLPADTPVSTNHPRRPLAPVWRKQTVRRGSLLRFSSQWHVDHRVPAPAHRRARPPRSAGQAVPIDPARAAGAVNR